VKLAEDDFFFGELPPMKRCTRCDEYKPIISFGKDKHRSDGLNTRCKSCTRAINRERLARDPEKWAAYARKRKYGISNMEFQIMRNRQGASCAVCREPLGQGREQVVDHCHRTGAVRGILCRMCNWGLGHFRDDRQRLIGAMLYLQRHAARSGLGNAEE
jgi:hypothetical protein